MLSNLLKMAGFLIAAVIGGVIVSLLGNHGGSGDRSDKGRGLPAYLAGPMGSIVEVGRMPAAARLKLGGYVEPRATTKLTAQGPGRVAFVAGQEGERVAAGQVVVGLDEDALKPEYRSAWAALAGDMAAQQNAQTQLYHSINGQPTSPMGGPGQDAYERMMTPFYNMAQGFAGNMFPGLAGGPTSPFGSSGPMMTQQQAQKSWPALNKARADYEQQMAALTASQARIDGLDQRLRDRRAIAPRTSVIMARHVRVGDVVQPGQPLADLADVDQLDVRIEVPTRLLAQLKVGDPVPVSLSNANVWAPISQIFPAADRSQRTITVKLALPAGSPAAPGMYALAWIAQAGGNTPSDFAPAIPTSAVVNRGSQPLAFVVDGQGRAEMRILRLGDVTGDRVAVLSGLQVGERLVANPAPNLKSGDQLFAGRP
ncbi:efflux RND transporter periplasmic adaptor subunit [Pinisolibacter sp.]|uniref:efflux RND transporter periplasmic adaptor subunit n=1 Tax=Pinisolibacter sp. TaxID=2172024 RepID=UPI002FDCB288